MKAAIKVTKLTKSYPGSKAPAVSELSLQIQPGEVYGLLGANGAGKSTAIRTIMDFIRPTSGTVTLLGHDTQTGGAALRKRVGYLSGDVVLPKRVTGRKLLEYLENLSAQADRAFTQQLVHRFEAQLDKQTQELSKGNRQKIGLVQAFMHQPDVLILDEPTSGLDPLMQEQFYKTIHEARDRGAAILLSSHSFEEVERVCDRVGIVRQGELVYEAPIAKLRSARPSRWRVTLKSAESAKKLQVSADVKVLHVDKKVITVEPSGSIERALAALSKVSIVSMVADQRDLEDEFLSFYGVDEEDAI